MNDGYETGDTEGSHPVQRGYMRGFGKRWVPPVKETDCQAELKSAAVFELVSWPLAHTCTYLWIYTYMYGISSFIGLILGLTIRLRVIPRRYFQELLYIRIILRPTFVTRGSFLEWSQSLGKTCPINDLIVWICEIRHNLWMCHSESSLAINQPVLANLFTNFFSTNLGQPLATVGLVDLGFRLRRLRLRLRLRRLGRLRGRGAAGPTWWTRRTTKEECGQLLLLDCTGWGGLNFLMDLPCQLRWFQSIPYLWTV